MCQFSSPKKKYIEGRISMELTCNIKMLKDVSVYLICNIQILKDYQHSLPVILIKILKDVLVYLI